MDNPSLNENDIINTGSFDGLLLDILMESILENVNIVNKKLQLSDTTDVIVKKSLKRFFSAKSYKNSIADFLINIDEVSNLKLKYYKKNGLIINKSDYGANQRIAIDEHLSYLNENGLNNRFNQPLRRIIYSNIYAGKSQNELETELKTFVSKKETLSRYIKQAAIQGADAYTAVIDQKITDKYIDKITGYTMVGSLIETSSPQCKFCVEKLKRKIKKEDWNSIKAIATGNGLIEGTDFKNLPTNKLHWGCRHQFTPIID
ncbi:hypothetical protein [Chryseobacterium sp. EO14]|uniref:hypothetical protein n=1 Tax=Chryseobacterium sp. EO14 TaxID=2950551 RepID=UPI00210D34EC|nr:hypothetical protein [Chryseobacterium sp. EO14]MCQ4139232.1 hypothetical protein [Chryseobacterium sp. EO14]